MKAFENSIRIQEGRIFSIIKDGVKYTYKRTQWMSIKEREIPWRGGMYEVRYTESSTVYRSTWIVPLQRFLQSKQPNYWRGVTLLSHEVLTK